MAQVHIVVAYLRPSTRYQVEQALNRAGATVRTISPAEGGADAAGRCLRFEIVAESGEQVEAVTKAIQHNATGYEENDTVVFTYTADRLI